VANTLSLNRNGAVGFIDWLELRLSFAVTLALSRDVRVDAVKTFSRLGGNEPSRIEESSVTGYLVASKLEVGPSESTLWVVVVVEPNLESRGIYCLELDFNWQAEAAHDFALRHAYVVDPVSLSNGATTPREYRQQNKD